MITHISILGNVIWYDYKGDEVCWDGKQYISLLSEGGFDTLEELDKFWEDYSKGRKLLYETKSEGIGIGLQN